MLCDSRETIPATLAILHLSGDSASEAILNAANFGRDADTIGAMVGGIVGTLYGISGLPKEWAERASDVSTTETDYSKASYGTGDQPLDLSGFDYVDTASKLQGIIHDRQANLSDISEMLAVMDQ